MTAGILVQLDSTFHRCAIMFSFQTTDLFGQNLLRGPSVVELTVIVIQLRGVLIDLAGSLRGRGYKVTISIFVGLLLVLLGQLCIELDQLEDLLRSMLSGVNLLELRDRAARAEHLPSNHICHLLLLFFIQGPRASFCLFGHFKAKVRVALATLRCGQCRRCFQS